MNTINKIFQQYYLKWLIGYILKSQRASKHYTAFSEFVWVTLLPLSLIVECSSVLKSLTLNKKSKLQQCLSYFKGCFCSILSSLNWCLFFSFFLLFFFFRFSFILVSFFLGRNLIITFSWSSCRNNLWAIGSSICIMMKKKKIYVQ